MKALVVERDPNLAEHTASSLRQANIEILLAYDGRSALHQWITQKPTLIVMAAELPKLDGLSVCRQIRAHSNTPILLLSEFGGDEHVIRGLQSGADDYIVKPFSPAQLLARCQAVMRRAEQPNRTRSLTVGGLTLDHARRNAVHSGRNIPLTPLEYRLLETLAAHPEQVLTAERLINAVWGANQADKMMLKQLVHRLRRKLESEPTRPLIETISGVGYALSAP